MQRANARRAAVSVRGARCQDRESAIKPSVQQDWKALGNYGTLGMEIALSVVVGLFGGQWLDKKLHTGGILTWVGFAYGLAAAGRAIYRAVRKSNREAEEAERREREARQKYDDDASTR
ncbi:MAG TPA: AtpZ/AtpI family protein [Polyangiaceae bacterium]|nr:AtpZ/AtpI family protein [Polyangiaceae bacterium]